MRKQFCLALAALSWLTACTASAPPTSGPGATVSPDALMTQFVNVWNRDDAASLRRCWPATQFCWWADGCTGGRML